MQAQRHDDLLDYLTIGELRAWLHIGSKKA
jgi:hypothetical protein